VEFERWIRYLVPGYVAIAPLIFAVAFLPNEQKALQTPLLAALVVLGPGAGFLVHQLHMFFHEWSYLDNSKRPIIVYIMKRGEKTKPREALLAWNYSFYDSKTIDNNLHNYVLRCWYFIHSFCSTGWAFLVGCVFFFSVFFIVTPFHLEQGTYAIALTALSFFPYIGGSYVIGCLFFFFKSIKIQREMERFEVLIVHRHWEKIEGILMNILQLRDKKAHSSSELTGKPNKVICKETVQNSSSADG